MKTKLFFIVLILLLIFVPSLFLNVRQTPEFEFDNEKRLNKNLINLTKKYPKVKFNINYYIENELLGEEKDKQKIKEVNAFLNKIIKKYDNWDIYYRKDSIELIKLHGNSNIKKIKIYWFKKEKLYNL